MSTMTSIARGTPALIVAPTQNTAPVYEFRCLFTPDLRKKKKIWHDGSLRFHTFNRRVMVYDDSKNYIGDAHWRDQVDFQEGEELRLDKGVLVEVGEQIGQSETDLAPVILEKRRPEATSSHPAAHVASHNAMPIHRPGGNVFRAQPKSLATVLGARHGPLGRARLPAQSPFEQRHVNVNQFRDVPEGRSAKRHKGIVEKENVKYIFSPMDQPAFASPLPGSMSEPQRTALSRPTRQSPVPDRRQGEADSSPVRSPVDLALGGQGARPTRSRLFKAMESVILPAPPAPIPTVASAQKVLPRADSFSSFQGERARQKASSLPLLRNEHPGGRKGLTEKPDIGTQKARGTVTNRLQFSRKSPRKKLMCKALLHSTRDGQKSKQQVRRSAEAPRLIEGSPYHQNAGSTTYLHGHDSVADFLEDDQSNMSATTHQLAVDRPDVGLRKTSSRPSILTTPGRSSSPLFEPQTPASARIDRFQSSPLEDYQPITRSISPGRRSSGGSQAQLPPTHSGSPREHAARNPEATKTPETQSSSTCRRQEPVDHLPFLESPTRTPSRPLSPERPSRRPMSARLSSLPREAVLPLKLSSGAREEHVSHMEKASRDQASQLHKAPTLVQRSVSDMTNLTDESGKSQGSGPINPAAEACFDPWSQVEAYLLFDWWPPDREKPSFVTTG